MHGGAGGGGGAAAAGEVSSEALTQLGALMATPGCALQELDLSCTGLSTAEGEAAAHARGGAVALLAAALRGCACPLRALQLGGNQLRDADALVLAEALRERSTSALSTTALSTSAALATTNAAAEADADATAPATASAAAMGAPLQPRPPSDLRQPRLDLSTNALSSEVRARDRVRVRARLRVRARVRVRVSPTPLTGHNAAALLLPTPNPNPNPNPTPTPGPVSAACSVRGGRALPAAAVRAHLRRLRQVRVWRRRRRARPLPRARRRAGGQDPHRRLEGERRG